MLREKFKCVRTHKNESTEAEHRDGAIRSSEETSVIDVERRDCVIPVESLVNSVNEEELIERDKAV